MKVSVVIPVYNERVFIEEVLTRVQASPFDKEIILVDDKSTDGTRGLLEDFDKAQSVGKREGLVQNGNARLSLENIRFLFQPQNPGKGAALRRGFGRDRLCAGRRARVCPQGLRKTPRTNFRGKSRRGVRFAIPGRPAARP